MEPWREYQHRVADLFRELGCIVEVDASVQGIRSRHAIDVWVRFVRFGIRQAWVVECKDWQRAVPQEKVLALRTIVDDVGADRGILVAESGHQSGAWASASSTNITLATLDELRELAKADLLSRGLVVLSERCARLRRELHGFWETVEQRHEGTSHSVTQQVRFGVDGSAMIQALGTVGIIQAGLEEAQLGKPEGLPYGVDESGDRILRAPDLESFVAGASEVLTGLEELVACQPRK